MRFGSGAWPLPVGETAGSKERGRPAGRGITRPAQAKRGRFGKRGRVAKVYPCSRGADPLGRVTQYVHGMKVYRALNLFFGALCSVCLYLGNYVGLQLHVIAGVSCGNASEKVVKYSGSRSECRRQ